MVRYALKPVEDISATAAGITRREFHTRISDHNHPRELVPLVHSFNSMLARLDDSFTRLSHYSGNLSPELRTPINTMMIAAEIALSRERVAIRSIPGAGTLVTVTLPAAEAGADTATV